MKPGYKTTEFYLAALSTIFSAVVASGMLPTDGEAGKVSAQLSTVILPLVYGWLRNRAKVAK